MVRVHDDGRVVVTDPSSQAERSIDIARQSISGEAFYVGSKTGNEEFLDGDIAEILVYSRPLTDEETQRLERACWRSGSSARRASWKRWAAADGLALHLDAARAKGDDHGNVALWTDLSGHAHDMQQPATDRMPQRVDGAVRQVPRHPISPRAVPPRTGRPCGRGRQFHHRGAVAPRPPERFAGDLRAEPAGKQAGVAPPSWLRERGTAHAGGNFTDGVLPVSAPIDWVGRDGWHDVIVRFAETMVELYVDGVLVDEEWPHGTLYRFPVLSSSAPVTLSRGGPGAVLGRDRPHRPLESALTPLEIAAVPGREEHVARRDREILGPPQQSLQYWRPRGKAYAGDCMVTCHDGDFHVFYLYDRLHHGAKWGLGAHQYGHFSSGDLKHWTHHPLAVPIERQWECPMGTGNVIYNPNDGKWYAFYTDCGSRIEFVDKPLSGTGCSDRSATTGSISEGLHPVLPGFDSDIFFVPETAHST